MMIALFLALQANPLPAPPTEPDIVVIGRKLGMILVDMKAAKRDCIVVLRGCRITRSSGEAELDAIPCNAAQECAAERMTTRKELLTCVEGRGNRRVHAILAARREAARDR